MELTKYDASLSQEVIGYMVNAVCSENFVEKVSVLQSRFKDAFGDAVYCPSHGALHITLMDWLAPLSNFGENKDKLFPQIHSKYKNTLQEVLSQYPPFEVTMGTYKLTDSCVIFTGTDKGQFNSIRGDFLSKEELMPGSKPPPEIIHCTAVAFREPVDKELAQTIVDESMVSFKEPISYFRLVRETRTRLQVFDEIEQFPLGKDL